MPAISLVLMLLCSDVETNLTSFGSKQGIYNIFYYQNNHSLSSGVLAKHNEATDDFYCIKFVFGIYTHIYVCMYVLYIGLCSCTVQGNWMQPT